MVCAAHYWSGCARSSSHAFSASQPFATLQKDLWPSFVCRFAPVLIASSRRSERDSFVCITFVSSPRTSGWQPSQLQLLFSFLCDPAFVSGRLSSSYHCHLPLILSYDGMSLRPEDRELGGSFSRTRSHSRDARAPSPAVGLSCNLPVVFLCLQAEGTGLVV